MTQIPFATTNRLLDCAGFLNWHYGVAFNTMITINFEQLGVTDRHEVSRTRTKLNTALHRKVIKAGEPYQLESQHHFIYAMECSRDHGLHMHLIMVAPGTLAQELPAWLLRWAKRNFGPNIDPKAVHAGSTLRNCDEYRVDTQNRMLRYILKTTADFVVVDQDGNSVMAKQLMNFKRGRKSQNFDTDRIAGASQSINYAMQVEYNYQPCLSFKDIFTTNKLEEFHQRKRAEQFLAQILRIDI